MTISQYLAKAIIKFQKHDIPNPQMEIELLLSFAINKNREFIISHPEYKLSLLDIIRLEYLSYRRAKNTPIAYLLGKKEFYGLDFLVNKHTLIPRPETEIIVDEVLNVLKFQQNPNTHINIVDVGTGSGCIPISIIKNLATCHLPLATCHFSAVDISPQALKVARKNSILQKTDQQLNLYQGNLLEPIINKIKNSTLDTRHSTFLISANLPYLTPEQIKNSPSIQKEPRLALVAGDDGLDCYRELFKQIKQLITDKSISDFYLICEIDPKQKEAMEKMAAEQFALQAKTKKDLRGLERFVIVDSSQK